MGAKQFAWLYLIEHGMAGRTPSFYGGYNFDEQSMKRCNITNTSYWSWKTDPFREKFLEEIREYGVNWFRTNAPCSETHSQFTDTFHDPDYKEFLEGTLVLNNGIKQPWCGEALEITNVFDMMALAHQAEQRFKDLFGED